MKPVETYDKKSGQVIKIMMEVASDTPSMAGFACELGVHRGTLWDWTERYPEFADAVKKAKDLQERFLIINGNKGIINTAFSIFMAKNVLKWSDQQEIKQFTQSNVEINATLKENLADFRKIIELSKNEQQENNSQFDKQLLDAGQKSESNK
jgi:hypothetical protein